MGKKSPPKAPDLKPLTDAQLKIAQMTDDLAREYLGMSREQFEFFKEQGLQELALAREQADKMFGLQERALASDEQMREIAGRVADEQLRGMEQTRGWAEADRRRYEEKFLPIEDRLIEEANAYDTPERREAEAARQMADVQRAAEAQRANADSRLRGMGIDPSQMRSGSLANQMATMTAAAQAATGNAARQNIEDRGRAMRADAANMGRGLPSQIASSYGLSMGAGNSAVGAAGAGQGATLGAIGAGAGLGQGAIGVRQGALGNYGALTGSPMQWSQAGMGALGMSSNSVMNAGNLMNSGFQNSMARYGAAQNANNSLMSNLSGLAGAAMGAWAEGGAVSRSAVRRQRRRYLAEGGALDFGGEAARSTLRSAMTDGVEASTRGIVDNPTLRQRLQTFAQKAQEYGVGQSAGAQDAMDFVPSNPIGQHFYAEGRAVGALPVKQSRDKLPAMLAEGEYVVPADVVRSKGIEFFDKLVAKYHREES